MEIRDPIHGLFSLSNSEEELLENPYVQRLRHIKQTGFLEFSFPGATHNRYSHSLGAMHLAGVTFDQIFRDFQFSHNSKRLQLRQAVRLGALLHDIGHGPLSHTTEEAMPQLKALKISAYPKQENRRATHEDFTIKIITDSALTDSLKTLFPEVSPLHVASLIHRGLKVGDDFFEDKGISFLPILSQLVSSELDVDRMDYLARDSYYCGTSYGHAATDWLINNLTYYVTKGKLNLAINRRGLYTFDDFLIARYHMYLMVYFHHKCVIYDETLLRYLKSEDCEFQIPGDIEEYLSFDDYRLHNTIRKSPNRWAQMIAKRQPFKMLYQSHDQDAGQVTSLEKDLKKSELEYIRVSSKGHLSKYYGPEDKERDDDIFVVDSDRQKDSSVQKIEDCTEIFKKYQTARKIERLYVEKSSLSRAASILER